MNSNGFFIDNSGEKNLQGYSGFEFSVDSGTELSKLK